MSVPVPTCLSSYVLLTRGREFLNCYCIGFAGEKLFCSVLYSGISLYCFDQMFFFFFLVLWKILKMDFNDLI